MSFKVPMVAYYAENRIRRTTKCKFLFLEKILLNSVKTIVQWPDLNASYAGDRNDVSKCGWWCIMRKILLSILQNVNKCLWKNYIRTSLGRFSRDCIQTRLMRKSVLCEVGTMFQRVDGGVLYGKSY